MADFKIPKQLLTKSTFQVLQLLLGVITTFLLVSKYSPESVGELSILMLISGALEIVFSFRSEVVLISGKREHAAFLFKLSKIIFLFSLLIFPISYASGFFVGVSSVLLFFSGTRIQNLIILYWNNENILMYGVFILIRPALVVIILLLDTPLIASYLIAIAITGTFAVSYIESNKLSNDAVRPMSFFMSNRKMLIRGLPASVLNYLSANVIQTILTLTGRTALLGSYAVANRLFLFGQSAVSSALTHEMMSELKRNVNTNFETFKRYFIFGLLAAVLNIFVFVGLIRIGGGFIPDKWTDVLDWSVFFVALASVKLISVHLSYFMAYKLFKAEVLVNIVLITIPAAVLMIEDTIEYYVLAQTILYSLFIIIYGYLAQTGDKIISNS